MKTTKTICIAGLLLLTGHALTAQTYFYNETRTFKEEGYTYQSDRGVASMVTLYNKENKYTYEPLVFKDGRDANGAIFLGDIKPLEDDTWTRKACGEIADKFFSAAERDRVKGKEYGVEMIIDSSTGKVIEVIFSFIYDDPFATIPVSTYRKIELELKEKIWFTPTADGKRMKYIMRFWLQEVSPAASETEKKSGSGTKISPIRELPSHPVE